MQRKVISLMACLGLISSTVFASPVNLPTGIKEQAGLQLGKDTTGENSDIEQSLTEDLNQTSVGYVFDYVGKRELSKDSGSANFDTMGGQITLSIYHNYDFYAVVGGVQNSQLNANFDGYDTKWDLSDDFMWEVGADGILYDWQSTGIQFFGDGNFKQASNIGLDYFTANGTQYSGSDFGSVSSKWEEWQVALGMSRPFQYVIPYGGVYYSDVSASAKALLDGTTYDLGALSSKYKVGPFVGISILPNKWLSIDVTGRFVAEEAVSVAATVKF